MNSEKSSSSKLSAANPLLSPESWNTAFGIPPFETIRPEHFLPAFEAAVERHRRELQDITGSHQTPDFENTIVALEKSGELLRSWEGVFGNLTASHTSPELQAVEREVIPKLAAHWSSVYLDAALFECVDSIHSQRAALGLDAESLRLVETIHLEFVRAGAKLKGDSRKRFAEIVEELAMLSTAFTQNLLADMGATALILSQPEDLVGLSEDFLEAARKSAEAFKLPKGSHRFAMNEATVTTFLAHSTNRGRREEFYRDWKKRGGNAGPNDNRVLVGRILSLRQEQALLLGFANYADYSLANTMARKPERARELLMKVWHPAVRRAAEEQREMERIARDEGLEGFRVEGWDWSHYAEKVRQRRFALDEAELKAYFPLDRMIEASFHVATRLFGLTFQEIPAAPKYHPTLRAWEVRDREGAHVGVFIGDYFARPSKRSGAWMNVFRGQSHLGVQSIRPIVVNNLNLPEPEAGKPALLDLGNLRTLFHEFGHGLHGLLSQVRYPTLSGTAVLRDFVEFPSQIFEHWSKEPELLRRFARHHETGESIPVALLDKVMASEAFNQGFATVEYALSALADLELHGMVEVSADFDPDRFEKEFREGIGAPAAIAFRHRLPQFLHLFAGDGYASKYYVYLWAGVLDADGYGAFREAGSPFAEGPARKLERIYSSGNAVEPMDAYREFRGRDPEVDALLKQRGLG